MDESTKKGIMLLKSLIFHYHGLEEEEQRMLDETAKRLNARNELQWANKFISEDYLSAFDRSRSYFLNVFKLISEKERLSILREVWEDIYKKGYVTEMETTAILTISKDWKIEKPFLEIIKD